jgi:hypothetical protein
MTRYFVTRTSGTVHTASSLQSAKAYASHLYRNCGVIAPLVVAAPDKDAAWNKAQRCYAGEITCAQARRP